MRRPLVYFSSLISAAVCIVEARRFPYFAQQWEERGSVFGSLQASSSSSDTPSAPRCVDIPRNFSLCYGIQYTSMRLPNLLEHEGLDEVIQQSDAWNSLLRLHCHPDTKLFLCSLFAPVCLQNLDKHIIQPCRSLCTSVQQGCESRMQQYGFPWPEMLRCDRFPEDNDMCIKPVGHAQSKANAVCKSCAQVATFENLMDNFCRSSIVLKAKLKSLNESHIVVRKSRAFKGSVSAKRSPSAAATNVEHSIRLSEEAPPRASCPCPVGESKGSGATFLVMASEKRQGTGAGGELVAKLIVPWKRDKAFKGAVRRFRKLNCNTLGREIRESVLRQTFKRTVF